MNLFDLNNARMRSYFEHLGEKPFRADQVMKWIYHEGVLDFDAMSNVSLKLRELLKEKTNINLPKIITSQTSNDGTIKWLLEVTGNNAIEMVYIPESERGTLCISSQAGCIMACPFCSTAHEGFNRNLTTAEIISQVWLAKQQLGWDKNEKRKITNVVFMGMGEPLLNYDATITACNMMMDDFGFGLSKRRVTLSTCGVVPKIHELKTDSEVSLAVSLHAANDELRDIIVPINRKYKLKELMQACAEFVKDGNSKKHITWEYVMLRGVNDSIEQARLLSKLIANIPSKVNLIPFNEFSGTKYQASHMADIENFQKYLMSKGILVTIRKTRGEDISAACGQLVGDVKDRSRRERILVRMEQN